jgi:hypothetical protein
MLFRKTSYGKITKMKKLLTTILAFVCFGAIAQTNFNSKASSNKEDINKQIQEYLQKSKNRKIGGLVLIGLGGGIILAGTQASKEKDLDDLMAGTMEFILGAGIVVGGMLEIISGINNKHKAKLLVREQRATGIHYHKQLHLGIAITL